MPKKTSIELPDSGGDNGLPLLTTSAGRKLKYIRRHEVERMLFLLEGRDRLIIKILWQTGVRVSELLTITPSDIDFKEGSIRVATLKKKSILPKKAKIIRVEIHGLEMALKENPHSMTLPEKLSDARKRLSSYDREPPEPRHRVIPISRSLSEEIASYIEGNGIKAAEPLFAISRIRVHQIIRAVGEKAEVERDISHPQAFRHGFGVNAILSGVPPLLLRTWMGHASTDSTLIYTQVLQKDPKRHLEDMGF